MTMRHERTPTPRQCEIFQHVANGVERDDIARRLGISESHVSTIVGVFRQILGCQTPKAIAEARKRGWIT